MQRQVKGWNKVEREKLLPFLRIVTCHTFCQPMLRKVPIKTLLQSKIPLPLPPYGLRSLSLSQKVSEVLLVAHRCCLRDQALP